MNYANLTKSQCQNLVDLINSNNNSVNDLTFRNNILNKLIMNANNLERVRESIKTFHNELENKVESKRKASGSSNKVNETPATQSQYSTQLESKITEISNYLTQIIEQIFSFIYDYKVIW